MSKSLKQMAYDTIEAHQETIDDLRTQLAKANDRVKRLEKILQRYESEQLQPLKLRVKELEKICKVLCCAEGTARGDKAYADWCDYQEQLRKEKE